MSTRDYVFTLTDGTTTITLNSAPWSLTAYVPTHPQVRLDKGAAVGYAGERVTGAAFNNVAETFSLMYTGTAANVVSAVQTIEAMLRLAGAERWHAGRRRGVGAETGRGIRRHAPARRLLVGA